MHNDSFPPGDLNDLERRLTGWQPSPTTGNADAMLFAAGQASLRGLARARLAWAVLACALLLLCVGLTGWLTVERTERQHLEQILADSSRLISPALDDPDVPASPENPIDNYLILRNRAVEQGVDAATPYGRPPLEPSPAPPASTPILSVGRRDGMIDF
jgi:hypothetical protein